MLKAGPQPVEQSSCLYIYQQVPTSVPSNFSVYSSVIGLIALFRLASYCSLEAIFLYFSQPIYIYFNVYGFMTVFDPF